MKPSTRFRIIAAALGLCSALGVAGWQLQPQPAEVQPLPARLQVARLAAPAESMIHSEVAAPSVPLPEPTSGLEAVMAGLQPKIDAALRASDYPAAHQVVDDALASSGLQGAEKQRLMVSKLGLLGMQGDHAGMLAWMNEIIAFDPTSPTAEKMATQRAAIEELANRGPDDPSMCATCKGMHGDAKPHLPHP